MKSADELASRIEAAYYNAYWNGAQKTKKSLKSIINSIYKDFKKRKLKRKPIDYASVDREFTEMEALRKHGRCKK